VSSKLAWLLLFTVSLSAQQRQAAPATTTPQRYRIAGTVVNSLTGQPVSSASVAIAPATQGIDRDISKSFTTGSDGRFSFSDLTRGKYSLMATARGFSLQYFEHHDPYASAIVVGPDLDAEHLVFRLQPDASVEGEVRDENNDPIQNAMVRLFQTSTDDGQQKTLPVNQVQTDDQGHYRIGHLPPGKYFLAVSARPWFAQNVRSPGKSANADSDAQAAQEAVTLDVTYPLTFYPDSPDSAGASPLLLSPGEKATADIAMHATPSLHLRIHTGAPADRPVPGRMAFPRVSQRIFEGYLDSLTNAPVSWVGPGVIELSGLAPGHYVIEMPPANDLGEKPSGQGWYREIDLVSDAEINAADGPRFAAIGGSIVFDNVSRVPSDSSIQLFNSETGESFRSDLSNKGEFDFKSDDVRPGRYLVALENANGFFLKQLAATGATVKGRVIEISGRSPVHITGVASRGSARVEGTAMHDGQPFAGAMIVLVPQDPGNNLPLFRRDQSDSDGTFTLTNVVPGAYTAIALANGWDLEWANPAVLQPYLKQGETVQVPAEGKLQIKVQVE
jgi:Carboxypeptidase regulatory-like domain